MTRGTLLTIGTAAINLANALRGITASIAAKTYGTQLNDQCREIQFKCDSGTIYMGDTSAVSSTDYGTKLLVGESKHLSDAESNSLNLSEWWIVAAGAGAKLSVEFTTL